MIAADNTDAKAFDWGEAKRRLEEARKSLLDTENLTPGQSEQILNERAQQLARVPKQTLDNSEVLEVVQFRLGGEMYAIGSEYVLELTFPNAITPIPHTEPHFVGVTNLRGEVTAVVDLGNLLGIPSEHEQRVQVLVLGRDRPEFAILVNGIEHVVSLRRDQLLDPIGVAGSYRDLMIGCTKEGLIVLGGDALLRCEDLYVDQSE